MSSREPPALHAFLKARLIRGSRLRQTPRPTYPSSFRRQRRRGTLATFDNVAAAANTLRVSLASLVPGIDSNGTMVEAALKQLENETSASDDLRSDAVDLGAGALICELVHHYAAALPPLEATNATVPLPRSTSSLFPVPARVLGEALSLLRDLSYSSRTLGDGKHFNSDDFVRLLRLFFSSVGCKTGLIRNFDRRLLNNETHVLTAFVTILLGSSAVSHHDSWRCDLVRACCCPYRGGEDCLTSSLRICSITWLTPIRVHGYIPRPITSPCLICTSHACRCSQPAGPSFPWKHSPRVVSWYRVCTQPTWRPCVGFWRRFAAKMQRAPVEAMMQLERRTRGQTKEEALEEKVLLLEPRATTKPLGC